MCHLIKKILLSSLLIMFIKLSMAQNTTISGKIISDGKPLPYVNLSLTGTSISAFTDTLGYFKLNIIKPGDYTIKISCVGFNSFEKELSIKSGDTIILNYDLTSYQKGLNEVVITGTMKEVSRSESPVPVEVYSPAFFKKNPTPNIYEALQNINGIRPQLNCNVCNTGDIHINGLEGPYTMILIDGMPIVSSLSTVYGLSGIPNSLIERLEVVKGPASSLYGSEAIGGLINVITKKPQSAPIFSADIFSTSWGEHNMDLGFNIKANKNISALTGINYFNFQNRVDNNNDNFTDITLQNRISIFQKWNFNRKESRLLSIAARYMYEDRFGGDMRWEPKFRGTDSIYGESIYTKRWELLGNYQLPTKEKLMLSFSYNNHHQNSFYGLTSFQAQQNIAFGQLTWDKKIKAHDLLIGTSLRQTFYDDNTPATASPDTINQQNLAQKIWLPGIFVQNELSINKNQKLLLGLRYDYNSYHGNILTPRLAYKWTINDKNIIRFNAGTGFRVVYVFTEDHAALTGAREVVIKNELNPERSYNANLNFIKKIYSTNGAFISLDASAFYTYYHNRIVANYEQDPTKIIYDNLNGFAQSKGISLNMDIELRNGLKIIAGGTLMDNKINENGKSEQQILTENFTGTWSVSYKLNRSNLSIDYSGNIYSRMRLPLLGELDPRAKFSPWWSIQNIQLSFSGIKEVEIFGGIKNLLNWTPNRGNPFIIARSNDPFDKEVVFDSSGKPLVSPNNPYALTFDPSYAYAPNQGIRMFLGLRYNLK